MHSKRRLADAALLIVDDDRVHRVNLDETICARFIDFPPPTVPRYRHDLDETGLLIPGCWFEPTPAADQRVPHNPENQAQNPLSEESGGLSQRRKARSRNESLIGQATSVLTEDNQNRMRSRAPLPCWFKPTCSEAAPPCDVRIGWKDETEPKSPRDAGKKASPARLPGPKATNFCAESARARNPSRVPLSDESGKRILLQWLTCRR
jgi:hypothetical protein